MKNYKIIFCFVLSFILASCEEKVLNDFVIQLQDDLPINSNPIKQVQALDGDNWIDGIIEDKTITFEFRDLEQNEWSNISTRFVTDENTKMVDPASSTALLDLSQGQVIVKATNGYTPLEYSVIAKVYPLIKSIEVTVGSETIKQSPSNETIQLSFLGAGINNAEVKLELNNDITLLSPSSLESIQDLTQPLEIRVKDNKSGKTRTYMLSAVSDWVDVTHTFGNLGIQIPSHMTVYKNSNLHGRNNNTGYLIKIPAGSVQMKTAYKELAVSTWFNNDQNVADVIRNNTDYSLFVGGVSLQYWKPILRPNVINNSIVEYEGNFLWNIRHYTSPPTLGVKNGKAGISYAETLNNGLYKFQTPQNGANKTLFTGGEKWDVDAAISGYAMPLQNGALQIANETEASYRALANRERNFIFSTANGMTVNDVSININGTNQKPAVSLSDAQRMARTIIGTTDDGGIMIFVSERYAQITNVLIDPTNYPSDGSTLLEGATILKKLGCTDAIAMHQSNFAVTILQDHLSGKDLTKTVTRSNGSDLKNSTLIMFK